MRALVRDTVSVLRRERHIRRTVVGYCGVFVGAHALLGSPRGLAYAVFVGVGAVATAAVHARHPLPRPLLWSIALFGLVHCAGGLLPSPDPTQLVLYETWLLPGALKLDQLVHLLGSVLATWVGWEVARDHHRRALRAAAFGTVVGLANELVEHLLDLAAPTFVGDPVNAAWDLVFNTAGVLVGLVLLTGGTRRAGRAEQHGPHAAQPTRPDGLATTGQGSSHPASG